MYSLTFLRSAHPLWPRQPGSTGKIPESELGGQVGLLPVLTVTRELRLWGHPCPGLCPVAPPGESSALSLTRSLRAAEGHQATCFLMSSMLPPQPCLPQQPNRSSRTFPEPHTIERAWSLELSHHPQLCDWESNLSDFVYLLGPDGYLDLNPSSKIL